MWKRIWRKLNKADPWGGAGPSDDPELREIFARTALRAAAAFALIFGFVFFAFWWSGRAVEFGARRASGQVQPTWEVSGIVRNAVTRQPVPWALVEDDPRGKPPLFHTDAGYLGSFSLLTLAEPHRIRVSAPGYRSASAGIGRAWFLWMPRGKEIRDIYLEPED